MSIELLLTLILGLEEARMEKDYIVEYSTRRRSAELGLVWTATGEATATGTLPEADPPVTTALSLHLEPPGEVIEVARSLEDPGDDAAEHRLVVRRGEEQIEVLSWSAATETAELASLREVLETSGHLALLEASVYAELAAALAGGGDQEAAAATLLDGIGALGKLYRPEGVLDDTGMREALGKTHLGQGRHENAVNVLTSVLATRLEMYRQAWELEDG